MKNKKIVFLTYLFLCFFAFETIVFADNDVCRDMGKLQTDLQNLFNLLKIVVPLLVIGLSTVDFIKAIVQKDEKDIKKAFIRLGKRFLCAILLFFLPVLLNFILNNVIGTGTEVCVK